VSLLTSKHAAQEKLSQGYRNISLLARNPAIRREVHHSNEAGGVIKSGLIAALYSAAMAATGAVMFHGTVTTVIAVTAMAAAAGGLIGGILAKCGEVCRVRRLQEEVDRGGLLLCVRTRDAEDEKRAVKILKKHSAEDIHLAPLAAHISLAADIVPRTRPWGGQATAVAYAEKPRQFPKLAIRQRDNVDGT
jgi:hypothetical protein